MILVTGANGRIGRHLVRALLDRGDSVRALVFSKGGLRPRKNLEIVEGDVTKKEDVRKAVAGVDTVYHLAAIIDYDAPKKQMKAVNIEGTQNVIEASKGKKLIYLSSTAVMGKKLSKIPADESGACRPTDYYGQTKLKAEKMVREAGGIAIRSADVYGSGFEEGYYAVMKGLDSGKLQIIGDGKNFIQYIHVSDLVQALLLARDRGNPGEVYIVTGDDVFTLEECFALLAKHLGVKPPAKHISVELAKFMARVSRIKSKLKHKKSSLAPEHVSKLVANRKFDISKAKNELGFQPHVSYDQGFKEMVDEYRSRQGQQGKQ